MTKTMRLGAVLFTITAVTGLILGGVHSLTREPIRAAGERVKAEALTATLPGAIDFKKIEIKGESGMIREINEGISGDAVVGYNFTVITKGYGGMIEFVIGISSDGVIKGMKILSHTETPGLGAKAAEPNFADKFILKRAPSVTVVKGPAGRDNEIQAISGATRTTKAVASGVNAALAYWEEHFKEGGR